MSEDRSAVITPFGVFFAGYGGGIYRAHRGWESCGLGIEGKDAGVPVDLLRNGSLVLNGWLRLRFGCMGREHVTTGL